MSLEFYVPQLDSTSAASTLYMTRVDVSAVSLTGYSGIYSIDINEDVARSMFRFSVYNSTLLTTDMSNVSIAGLSQAASVNADKDVGFYIQSGKFPVASPNYTAGTVTGGSPAPLNPLLAAKYVGHADGTSFDDNNVATIGQEFMGHVAKTLFTTAKASAIFNNEFEFIKQTSNQDAIKNYYSKLYDASGTVDTNGISDAVMTTAQILTDTQRDVSSNPLDTRHRNKIARNIFYGIVKDNFSRISNGTTGVLDSSANVDVATNTYPIPVKAGDSFSSYVTITAPGGQAATTQSAAIFGTSAITIPNRTYRVVLNIVPTATAASLNTAYAAGTPLAFTRASQPVQGVSPTAGATVTVNGTVISKSPTGAINLNA
jgi:hypothetical protein